MNLPFNIVRKDENNIGYIEIKGVIGEVFWGDETSKEMIKEDIEKIKNSNITSLVVEINSLGGDVNHALTIYDLINDLDIPTTTRFSGFNASSATVIGMASDIIEISENGFFLIHQPFTVAISNLNEMKNNVDFLQKLTDRITAIYSKKVDQNIVETLMNEENGNGIWLNATETVEYKFADSIYQNEEEPVMAKVIKDTADVGLPTPGLPKETPEAKSIITKIKDGLGLGKKEETKDEEIVEDSVEVEPTIQDVLKEVERLKIILDDIVDTESYVVDEDEVEVEVDDETETEVDETTTDDDVSVDDDETEKITSQDDAEEEIPVEEDEEKQQELDMEVDEPTKEEVFAEQLETMMNEINDLKESNKNLTDKVKKYEDTDESEPIMKSVSDKAVISTNNVSQNRTATFNKMFAEKK